MIRSQLQKLLDQALTTLPQAPVMDQLCVSEPAPGIEADLSSNMALALAKKMQTKPADLAQKLAAALQTDSNFKEVHCTPNGYLNFKFSDSFLAQIVRDMADGKKSWFCPDLKDKHPKTLIEFVSANPTGPLHIGHGRGAALGDSLARIYRACGIDVETEYYINDIGVQMQILAQSVQMRWQELFAGAEQPFLENGYKGEYVKDIARLMQQQQRQDFESFPKSYILEWITGDLRVFNVTIDNWFSEQSLIDQNRLQQTLDHLQQQNVLKEENGALWFVGAEKFTGRSQDKAAKTQDSAQPEQAQDGQQQDRVLRKSDGRYTYFASDIAYHYVKSLRGFKHCIDIWGHDHHGYVPRMQSAMTALGLGDSFLQVLLYQLVSLKREGKKIAMSTRSGEFITLREILDEVGTDACRFFFAMRSPHSQLEFDVDLAKKQSNENPVFYVQYVHARICSIFHQAQVRGIALDWQFKTLPELTQPERDLIVKIASLGDVLQNCVAVSSPHLVASYLMECAVRFHKFYDACPVLSESQDRRAFRLALLESVRRAIALGLDLLGVSAPTKM